MKKGLSVTKGLCALSIIALSGMSSALTARADDVQSALEKEWKVARKPVAEDLKLGGYWSCTVFRDLGRSYESNRTFRFIPAGRTVFSNTGEYGISAFAHSELSLAGTVYCDRWKRYKKEIFIRVDTDGNLIAKENDTCGNSRDYAWYGPRVSYYACAERMVEGEPYDGR